jgi:hypothetical protein
MNRPNPGEIQAALEERRERDRERMRREEAAMDAFAVEAVRSLTESMRVVAEDPDSWRLQPIEPTPVETVPATWTDPRPAIEARRQRGASSSPAPEPGEPPLRAALRGIVADYAEPITPAEWVVTDLEERSGISLDETDTDGLWADIEHGEVLGFRAAMESVVQMVTNRAEAIIIAELVAAQERLALEYPDVARPALADATTKSRGR